jgi:hypothetical protein
MKIPSFIKYAVVAVLAIAIYRFVSSPRMVESSEDNQAFLKSLETVDDSKAVLPSIPNSKEVILIKVRNEPKVIEAIITDAKVLYVSVRDDGTRRNGYAEYLCMIAKSSFVERVKVIKVNSQNSPNRDNAYGILLGESWCKTR